MLLSEDKVVVNLVGCNLLDFNGLSVRGRRNISVLRVSILPQIATGLGSCSGVCILGDTHGTAWKAGAALRHHSPAELASQQRQTIVDRGCQMVRGLVTSVAQLWV
jgi:hypothetical protein